MADEPADENRLVVSGVLCNTPELRRNPADVPLARFTIEHASRRSIAGVGRETRFRIVVIAAGAELSSSVSGLAAGNRVRIDGYLSRSDYRRDERHLILHAESIVTLPQQD